MLDINSFLLEQVLYKAGNNIISSKLSNSELTIEVTQDNLIAVSQILKSELDFTCMIDLFGLDYQEYAKPRSQTNRFAVVIEVLSIKNNKRIRIRAWCDDDEAPSMPSVCSIWPAADWFERESYDMYGIYHTGHQDLRRILTDYGFIGHPMRKDFPSIGYTEVSYDEDLKRIVYKPVTIEDRDIVPRIVRENGYSGVNE